MPPFLGRGLVTNKNKSTWSENDNSSFDFPIYTFVSTYSSQRKVFARVEITLFIFAHSPCTHLPHIVHINDISITFFLHLAHGSTLLLRTSSYELLTITSVFLRLTFNLLLSNASFHFKNFSFKFSILSLI